MSVQLGTFSSTQERIIEHEQAAANTVTTETVETTTATPEAAATTENTAEVTTETAQVVEEKKEDQLDFNLELGEGTNPTIPTTEEKPTPQVYNWKDELKKVDRKELLKEIGVNDFSVEIDEYIAKGGNPADYIQAKAVDYNNISDEDLIKEDYRRQFPNFTKEEINRLFNRKYGTTEEMDEEEKQDKLLELKADGHIKRQSKITDQQKFKIPEAVIPQTKDEAYEQWRQLQDSQPKMMEQLRSFYADHEATKALNESKKVALNLGENVPPFFINIDQPEAITRGLTDDGTIFRKLTTTQSGEPDVVKQQLIMLFSHNPQKFMQGIFNYGQSFGVRNKIVEDGQNAKRPDGKVLPIEMNGAASYGTGKYGDKSRN